MLRRLFAAVKQLNKNISQKSSVAVQLSGASKTSHPSSYLNAHGSPKITNAFYDTSNLGINSIEIVRNMPANADSERIASVVSETEQDLVSPETLVESDTGSPWIVAEDDCETLDALKDSYVAARKESTSKWLDYNKTCHIYLYRGGGEPSEVMAAFDLDGTIIKPKSNKRIPRTATDWQFFSVWTKVKIQQALKENQARFVIFTNQNGVGLNIVPLEEVQERIELVTSRLNIPCIVFVAIDKDEFRKPNVGMFELFRRSFNESGSIDKEKSFYCGDAVGYPSHSDADIKFAQRLRLPFLPPEKFLRGVKPKLVETSK